MASYSKDEQGQLVETIEQAPLQRKVYLGDLRKLLEDAKLRKAGIEQEIKRFEDLIVQGESLSVKEKP